MMAGYSAAQAPIFTLYGDGTVIFRNPLKDPPAAQGSTTPFNPLRTAKLNEDQVVELLTLALGEGGLAVARPNYDNPMVADVGTTVFTIDAGGIKKAVSIMALGMDVDATNPDGPARAGFKKLADRLADFDQGRSIETAVYEPKAYRATLVDGGGMAAPDMVDWPWSDLAVKDFKPDGDPNGLQFPHATLTPDRSPRSGSRVSKAASSARRSRARTGSHTSSRCDRSCPTIRTRSVAPPSSRSRGRYAG